MSLGGPSWGQVTWRPVRNGFRLRGAVEIGRIYILSHAHERSPTAAGGACPADPRLHAYAARRGGSAAAARQRSPHALAGLRLQREELQPRDLLGRSLGCALRRAVRQRRPAPRRGSTRLAYRPTSIEQNGCIEYEYDDGRLMTGCVED